VPGQGARFAKENILESREKAAFQKIATPFRGTRNIAIKCEAFCLAHFSGGRQKFFFAFSVC
jgi:hypothetical protein